MPVTPTGPFSLPLARARELLSTSTAFQTLASAVDAAAALNSIHLVAHTSPTRPFAIVGHGPIWQYDRVQQYAAAEIGAASGQTYIMIEQTAGDGASIADAEMAFTNAVGAIVQDLIRLSAAPGKLGIIRITAGQPRRSHPDENASLADGGGDYYQILLTVHWSDNL